jgi:phage virion morphogenesis protein
VIDVTAELRGSDQVVEVMRRLMGLGTDPGPFLRPLGLQLLRSTRERARQAVAPDGSAWPALSERYAARKRGPKMLRESGVLLGGLVREVSGHELRLGSVEPYAAIHQFGGEAGRDLAATIPARPYLGLSAEDEEMIREEFEAFAARARG